MIIYVGDARDVVKRIRTNHCNGNVEASVLRRYIAEVKGYRIKSTKRQSRSKRIRIDLSNPHIGERDVSDYIHSGEWRYIIFNSFNEAHDFQWFVIEQLKPILNKECKGWNTSNLKRYQSLLQELTNSSTLRCGKLHKKQSGPGIYVFYHQKEP